MRHKVSLFVAEMQGGFNASKSEQLPADSSGIVNIMSDSEFGSSDSSSTGGIGCAEMHLASNGISGIMMPNNKKPSTIVQNQTYVNNPTVNNVGGPSPNNNNIKPMKSPSLGKPAAMRQNIMPSSSPNKNTDHFLSQFQAQMSQMKMRMDAVQNEILLHSSSSSSSGGGVGGGKPRSVAVAGGLDASAFLYPNPSPPVNFPSSHSPQTPPVKRGPGRPKGSGTSAVGSSVVGSVRYQSQISMTNGLKMKIKKSPRQGKKRGPKKGRRRRKGADDDDDDDDFSDRESEPPRRINQQKSTKLSQIASNDALLEGHESAQNVKPIGWGDTLPEDVLARIFHYAVKYEEGCIPVLVRVMKVSRLWWKVASRPELWTSVDLSSSRVKDKFKIERNLIYFLEQRFQRVKHLNLGGWSSALTNVSIDVMIRYCTDLESLALNGCQKLTAQNLKTITESCASLKKLDLSSISTTYNTKTAVSPSAIGEAAEALGPRMAHISLASNCLANCPQIVTALADNCPNLLALDLSNVYSPRRDSIAINLEHLQQGCQKLKILRLTNSDFFLSETPIKEQVCSSGFPDLEELSIAVDPKRCQGMDEGDLERILKNANKLRLLDVRGCARIGDSGLVRISAWDLEHLYLSGCYATKSSNDGLELVARKWRHSFKEIDFSWTPGEDTINSAMKALAEMDPGDAAPPLKFLDLCGSSVSFESVKVTLRTCTNLERLNLTSCRALPRGIKRNYQTPHEIRTLREQVLSGKFDDNQDD